MQFLKINQSQTHAEGMPGKFVRSYEDAEKVITAACSIDVRELTSLFGEYNPENFNLDYLDPIKQRRLGPEIVGCTIDPYFPFIDRKLYEGDRIFTTPYTHGSSAEALRYAEWKPIEKDPSFNFEQNYIALFEQCYQKGFLSKEVVGKVLPLGTRTYFNGRDYRTWVFYNWLRRILIKRQGFFLDDESRIPDIEEFVRPFSKNYLGRPLEENCGFTLKEKKREIQHKSELFNTFGPLKYVREKILSWIDSPDNDHKLVSIRFVSDRIMICVGMDTRILAYYAMQDKVKPECIKRLL